MDEKELARSLDGEGFRHTYVWEDEPNAFYPDHTHAHIILHGELTLTMSGKTETFRAGSDAMFRLAPFILRKWGRKVAAI